MRKFVAIASAEVRPFGGIMAEPTAQGVARSDRLDPGVDRRDVARHPHAVAIISAFDPNCFHLRHWLFVSRSSGMRRRFASRTAACIYAGPSPPEGPAREAKW